MIPPEDRDPAVPIFSEAPEGTPWMAYDFITVGAKHVWFWRYEPGGPTHGANHKDWSPELHLAENPCILVKKDPMCAFPPHQRFIPGVCPHFHVALSMLRVVLRGVALQ